MMAFVLGSGLFGQVTEYASLSDWMMAVSDETHTENFNGFASDVEFRSAALECNGFTLQEISQGASVENFIDVLPLSVMPAIAHDGTGHARLFVDKLESGSSDDIEVELVFATPSNAFYGEFASVATGDFVLIELYDENGLVVQHNLSTTLGTREYGFTVDPGGLPILSMTFTAENREPSPPYGELFSMDNIRMNLEPAPIPTLSEWSLISLSLILMIIGVCVLNEKRRLLLQESTVSIK